MITGFYVRLQVVSGPRDADLSVPSVACERLEAASAEHYGGGGGSGSGNGNGSGSKIRCHVGADLAR